MAKKYINPNLKKMDLASRLERIDIKQLSTKIIQGDRNALSTGITLVESTHKEHRKKSRQLLSLLSDASHHQALRIAISGSPGAGKSSLIESLASFRPDQSLAVLAIDPSSSESHGSILGDKTRMETLVGRENAFIRPSAAGKTLGGVASKTREAVILCEAAGFDNIIVETVGVGQSETMVSKMVDMFILLILPGSGDEVQGIKRGIVELADMVLVTKTDGDRLNIANESRRAYKNALHLFRQKNMNWDIPVINCSALSGKNMEKVWQSIDEFRAFAQKKEESDSISWLDHHRQKQNLQWYEDKISETALEYFLQNESIREKIEKHKTAIQKGDIKVWEMLRELIKK